MRLSYSSSQPSCWRRFQLTKLLSTGQQIDRSDTPDTMFGRAWGAGVAELLLSGGDIERAIGKAFCEWDSSLEKAPKYLQVLFSGLFQIKESFPFDEYAALYLPDDRPAAELGARIWLDEKGEQDYWVMFLDICMLHIPTGRPTVVEVKSTKRADDPKVLFSNSPQGLQYSLVLPALFPEYSEHSWDTLYIVARVLNTYKPEIAIFPVEYSRADRLSALLSIMLEYDQINAMRKVDYFPKGKECVAFGRICDFFGVCDNLAASCKPLSLELQNNLEGERNAQVIVDLHMQELLEVEITPNLERE